MDDKEIFNKARKIPDPEVRDEYLNFACGDDANAIGRIRKLLEAASSESSFMQNPSFASLETQVFESESSPVGQLIGPYKILQEIGKGGMGSVFMAEQEKPVRRRVAIKIIRPGKADKQLVARFEAERQALAMMEHQNIAKVLDAGQANGGSPYLVMELIQGIPITKYCDQNKLTPIERLKLFVPVCKAIQHAHQKGILHRDLKPANVLVCIQDGQPVPKVIDFGLAKPLQHQVKLTDKTMFTEFGQVLGTLQYMSPEQAVLDALDVDTRSDIYSLGIMLYELLSGSTPVDKETLRQNALLRVLEIIREQDPPRPSVRLHSSKEKLTAISQQRQIQPSKLEQMLRNELDWVVMKALEKDRTRRYESANDLASDIEKYLKGDVVMARPPTFSYRTTKYLSKHRKFMAVATSIAFLLAIGFYILNLQRAESDRQRIRTEAKGLVQALLSSEPSRINDCIQALSKYESWARDDLQTAYTNNAVGSSAKLHAALALIPYDKSVLPFLKDQLLTVTPFQFKHVRDLLKNDKHELVASYWAMAKTGATPDIRFQAACALATYDTDNRYWQNREFQTFIANHLVGVRPSELMPWKDALRPVKSNLISILSKIYRNPNAKEQVRSFATDALVDYLGQDPNRLFDLLADANESQFKAVFNILDNHKDRAIKLGNSEIAKQLQPTAENIEKEALAKRKANASIMLMRMDAADQVWPLLRHSPDPRVRSFIIHWFSLRGGNVNTIISRYEMETDVTIKRALLMCLGEFEISDRERQALVNKLLAEYRDNHDAGLHSTAEWLLRKWKRGEALAEIDKELQQRDEQLVEEKDSERQWYINGQGQTFVILDADEFQMGSPPTEPYYNLVWHLHNRKIGRRFAISAKEVTRSQWRRFSDATNVWLKADLERLNRIIGSDDAPMVAMTWYEAAWYCNWLSEQEGIPRSQWCYEPNDDRQYGPGMKAKDNYLELSGYRLPTEAEWEFACRARANTSRFYGTCDKLLPKYSWFQDNTDAHSENVATLKPNDFGVFDMLGNVHEWCYDEFKPYTMSTNAVLIDNTDVSPISDTSYRVLRGGSYNHRGILVRSAGRETYYPTRRMDFFGFRPVRTFNFDALEKYFESIKALEQKVSQSKENKGVEHLETATALHELAVLLLENGNYANSLPNMKEAYEIRRKLLGSMHRSTLELMVQLLELHVRLGHQLESLPIYQEITKLKEEGDLAVLLPLGEFLIKRAEWGDWKPALLGFEILIELKPSNAYYHRLAAFLSIETKDLAEFDRICNQMMTRFSKSQENPVRREILLATTVLPDLDHDWDLLQSIAEEAVQAADKNPGAQIWPGMLNALVAYRRGDFKNAIKFAKEFDKARSHRIPTSILLLTKAMSERKLNREGTSIETLNEATELMKDFSSFKAIAPNEYWRDWLNYQILLREAKQLIESPID